MTTYLFILSTHNAGSSKLAYDLGACKNVSLLPGVEGWRFSGDKCFPKSEVHRLKFERLFTEHEVFSDPSRFDWEAAKAHWCEAWDMSKPILLQKSPVIDILHADTINRVFRPVKFIILVRDPYATVEGHIRRCRQNSGFDYTAERCARHWLRCTELLYQASQSDLDTLVVRYEDLCASPEKQAERMRGWLPELCDFDPQGWINKNEQGRCALTPGQYKEISQVLEGSEATKFFGY